MTDRRTFPPNSRYADVEQVEVELADGRRVVHLRRRILPQPEVLSTLSHHRVSDAERIDHAAAVTIGDPLAWWQLADANGVFDPEDLVRDPGAVIRVAYPRGVRGA